MNDMSEVERDRTWLLSEDQATYSSFDKDAREDTLPDLDNTTLMPITGVLFVDEKADELEEIQCHSSESFGVYSDLSGNEDDGSMFFQCEDTNGVAVCNMCGARVSSSTAADTIKPTCHLCCGDAPLMDYQSLYLLADDLSIIGGCDGTDDCARYNEDESPSLPTPMKQIASDEGGTCSESCGLFIKYLDSIVSAIKPTIEKNHDAITKSFQTYQSDLKSRVSLPSFFEGGSLSYSSLDDLSQEEQNVEKENTRHCPNELGKLVSYELPNGLYFCTIWINQALDKANDQFIIQNGNQVVWKPGQQSPPQDLLECFSWASQKDHSVVQRVNSVVQQLLQEPEPAIVEHDEVVLWTSPEEVHPHFVDVRGNEVDAVDFITDKDGSHRILFFVKAIEADLVVLAAPSDETRMAEEEETVLEANDETSAATTAVDNRNGSLRNLLEEDNHVLELD